MRRVFACMAARLYRRFWRRLSYVRSIIQTSAHTAIWSHDHVQRHPHLGLAEQLFSELSNSFVNLL